MKRLLTITEFIDRYGVSRSTVYRLFETGIIKPIKIGRATRIKIEDAEAWLDGLTAQSNMRAA
jgi:excisionase family DNA binding protein